MISLKFGLAMMFNTNLEDCWEISKSCSLLVLANISSSNYSIVDFLYLASAEDDEGC